MPSRLGRCDDQRSIRDLVCRTKSQEVNGAGALSRRTTQRAAQPLRTPSCRCRAPTLLRRSRAVAARVEKRRYRQPLRAGPSQSTCVAAAATLNGLRRRRLTFGVRLSNARRTSPRSSRWSRRTSHRRADAAAVLFHVAHHQPDDPLDIALVTLLGETYS